MKGFFTMRKWMLPYRGVPLLLGVFSIAVGITIPTLGEKWGYTPLVAGVFALPIALAGLFSISVAWAKVKRLSHEWRWWHILWALFFLSGLTFRVRGTGAITENPLDAAALFRVGLVGVVGIVLLGALVLNPRLALSRVFEGLVGLLAFYSLVGIASTLWSVYPAWTLYKSVEYLVGVALIGTIVASVKSEAEFKSLFDWMWLLWGLVALSVWIGVVLWPDETVWYGVGLLGIQIHGVLPRVPANGVGHLGALLGIIALVRLLFTRGSSRRLYLMIFLIGIVMLAFSQSRSPLTGFLLAVPLVLFSAGRIGWVAFLSLFLLAAASFTPLGDYFWQFFLRGQSEDLFFSLSGRIYYWVEALPFIQERPLIGYGAYAAGRFLIASGFNPRLSSLHGTWPEVLIGTGVLGLLPLLGAIAGTWVVLLRKKTAGNNLLHEQLRLEAIGVMALLSVRSIFSVPFIWHPALTWLLALGYAEYLRRHHARASHPQSLPPTRR